RHSCRRLRPRTGVETSLDTAGTSACATNMPIPFENDGRIVMTLDAGGTNLKFGALRGGETLVEGLSIPSEADNLDGCLSAVVRGFESVKRALPEPPAAISFAFPGPADYPRGIIGDLPNFPSFRGGHALGPTPEQNVGTPRLINND